MSPQQVQQWDKMMTMVHFDTLQYAKNLEKSGFSQKQAEALARVNQEALSKSLDSTLATKKDVTDLKDEIHKNVSTFKEEMRNDMTDLKGEIHEVKMDVLKLESTVSLHSWMLSTTLAGIGALLLKAFF